MTDYRKRNTTWKLNVNDDGSVPQMDAQLSVLMDIRDEMLRLNRLLHCSNFVGIPRELANITKNTRKPRKVRRTRRTAP